MFCVVVKNTLNVNIPVFNIQQSFVSGIKRKWLSIGLQVTLQKKGNFNMEVIKTHIRKPTSDINLIGLPQYTFLQIMDFSINSGSEMEAQKCWRDFSNFISRLN